MTFALAIVAVHAITLGWVARARSAPASRRQLAAILALTVPAAGAVLAALAMRVRGNGRPGVDELDAPLSRPIPSPEAIHRITSAPAALERICAGDDERRTVMSALARREDPDAVSLLRWTIERRGGEAAVDAALTLEDLGHRHEQRLEAARERARQSDDPEPAIEAGDAAAALIHHGLADPPLIPALADEARRHWQQAGRRGADAARLAERRARLELDAQDPAAALEALADARPSSAEERERVARLRTDAAFAARRFDPDHAA